MATHSSNTKRSLRGVLSPPNIFNLVVDTVTCHWVTLVAGEEAGPDGFK